MWEHIKSQQTDLSFEKHTHIFPPLLVGKIWIFADFKLKLLLLISSLWHAPAELKDSG